MSETVWYNLAGHYFFRRFFELFGRIFHQLATTLWAHTGDADVAYLAGAEYRKTPRAEMMGVTTVLNCAGVERNRFLEYTERNPATYRDWSRTWEQETTGKEDHLRSPYLDREFEEARQKV